MPKDTINYGELIDEAMHIIVRKALEVAQNRTQLGEHHFFISFITTFPGVVISEKLHRRYPREMTIVLQFQYEDLKVSDKEFSVILSFDNVKERIIIPFEALTAFADPSVKFGLQFRHIEFEEEEEDGPTPPKSGGTNSPSPKDSKADVAKKKLADNVVKLDAFRKK